MFNKESRCPWIDGDECLLETTISATDPILRGGIEKMIHDMESSIKLVPLKSNIEIFEVNKVSALGFLLSGRPQRRELYACTSGNFEECVGSRIRHEQVRG